MGRILQLLLLGPYGDPCPPFQSKESTLNNFRRAGGIAALIAATTFVVGFWLYFSLLIPARYGSASVEAAKHAAFLVENQAIMYAWNLVIYVAFGMVLVVLALALNERLKASSPATMQVATAFGIIWAALAIASGMVANIGTDVVVGLHGKDPSQAGSVWQSLNFVVNGLGGGNEIVGGLWVLLVSWVALRAGGLPKALSYLGAVAGIAGLLTAIPALKELGSAFGLGLILWFIWLGIVLLREDA